MILSGSNHGARSTLDVTLDSTVRHLGLSSINDHHWSDNMQLPIDLNCWQFIGIKGTIRYNGVCSNFAGAMDASHASTLE